MTPKTAQDRLRYAKQYASVLLLSGNYQISSSTSGVPQISSSNSVVGSSSTSGHTQLLQLSPNKRIHVMKALSCLAKYLGCYDSWAVACRKYQLSWSTGTEKIDAFTRFFDNTRSLDTMLHQLQEAIEALPVPYSRFLIFCTLTGLRGSEAIESVRLLTLDPKPYYYNPEQQTLQHYRFPEFFIRRTKAVYISVVNDQIIGIAKGIGKSPL